MKQDLNEFGVVDAKGKWEASQRMPFAHLTAY